MLQIAPLSDVPAAYEIGRAAAAVDTPDIPFPSPEAFDGRIRLPWPGSTHEQHLAILDGAPAGHLELNLPQLDNQANINVQLTVHPAWRRRGVGRALHAFAVERVRALGRTHLIAPTIDRHPDGAAPAPASDGSAAFVPASEGRPAFAPASERRPAFAPASDGSGAFASASEGRPAGGGPVVPAVDGSAAFATAMGAVAGLVETRSRLEVGAVDPVAVADGYRIVQWTGVGPEEHLGDIAYLAGRLNEDAPTGDIAWEAEKHDAERVRAAEETSVARQRTVLHTGAVHEATGRLVAWTRLACRDDVRWHAWQDITIVDPGHRGQRLGLAVKVGNLRYARRLRPELRAIDTFNAAENAHMLRINQALGFRPVDAWTQWQVTV
jgi:GNAT superfamily N-acetyltransferase